MCKRIPLNVALFMAVSFVCFFGLVSCRSYNNGLIFYDVETFQTYLPPTVSVSRGRGLASVKFSEKGSIWSTFGKPCECTKNICGCCAGIKVKQYNFDQKMCANVTFVPPKEVALLEVYLNEKPSSKYGISVRNPSPFCIPVMMGIPMAMCVQMSDIAIKGDNLNMCMDFVVRLATTDLFEMHFQCMLMGLDGFQYVDKDGNPVIPPSNSKNDSPSDDDYYDYEADENEISYGIGEPADSENEVEDSTAEQLQPQPQKQYQMASHSINAISLADDGNYAAHLQQQMQQLQNVHQYDIEKIEKDNSATRIRVEQTSTPTPIVVETESEPDMIAANTTTYGSTAESEDETKTVTKQVVDAEMEAMLATPATIISQSPVYNDYGNGAHSKNHNDNPSTTTIKAVDSVNLGTTTGTPVSKPIAAPISEAFMDIATNDVAMTSENIDAGNTKIADTQAAPLETSTGNYASHITEPLNGFNDNINFEATTVTGEDDTAAAYIAAPDTATTALITTEATKINSTNREDVAPSIATSSNAYSQDSVATTNETFTSSAPTTASPAANAIDSVDTVNAHMSKSEPKQPEMPAAPIKVVSSYPSYRRFYG